MPTATDDTLTRLRDLLHKSIKSGLSLREVGRRAGVGIRQLCRLNDGDGVSVPTAEAIAGALGYRLELVPATAPRDSSANAHTARRAAPTAA